MQNVEEQDKFISNRVVHNNKIFDKLIGVNGGDDSDDEGNTRRTKIMQKQMEQMEKKIENDPAKKEFIQGHWIMAETDGQKRAIRTKVQCAHKRNEQFEKKYEETRADREERKKRNDERKKMKKKYDEENKKLGGVFFPQHYRPDYDQE